MTRIAAQFNFRALPLLPIGVLAVLVILTFWLSRFVQPFDGNASAKLRHDPESIVEKFVAQKMNSAGDVQYVLKADKLMHYPDDDSSLMENVLFTAITPDKPQLTMRAPKGQILNANDEIKIFGGVVMQTMGTPKNPPMQLTTPSLTFFPKQNLVRSTTGVLLTTPTMTVNAAALEFNSQTRALNMTQVRGQISRVAAPASQ